MTTAEIEQRIRELEAMFLVPTATEEDTLALLLEYFELDNELCGLTDAQEDK